MNSEGIGIFEITIAFLSRYQRTFDKIEGLMQKVQTGKAIDVNDIPVSIRVIRSGELHETEAGASVASEPKVIFCSQEILLE